MARSYTLSLSLLALLQSIYVQGQQVYIPGDIDEDPSASLSIVATGVDGYTTYDILGVTLAENTESAIMTEYGTNGGSVYSCNFGTDSMATCSVSQYADGVTYAYTEPIVYFSGSGVDSAAIASSSTALSTDATSTASTTSSSDVVAVTSTSSSSASPISRATTSSRATSTSSSTTSSSTSNTGPVAGQVQATSANVFTGKAGPSFTSGLQAIVVCGAALLGAAILL